MTFSIIIPTHNRKELLRACLESLLGQDYPKDSYEIIIVDDGSSDGTADMIKSEFSSCNNLKYFIKEKQGPAIARNFAVSGSAGNIMVFTDSDCVASGSFLRRISECFGAHADIAAVGGEAIPVFKNGVFSALTDHYKMCYEKERRKGIVISGLNFSTIFRSDCGAIKKDVFLALGGFNPKFPWAGEDHDMSIKILASGYKICKSPDVFVYHDQRKTVKALLAKYYECGIWDTVNFRDYFKNWLVLSLPFEKIYHIPNSPITALLRIKTFEIISFLVILAFIFPKAGLPLLFIYFVRGLYFSNAPGRTPRLYFLSKLHIFLVEAAFLAGIIVGSIKNKVIYI